MSPISISTELNSIKCALEFVMPLQKLDHVLLIAMPDWYY